MALRTVDDSILAAYSLVVPDRIRLRVPCASLMVDGDEQYRVALGRLATGALREQPSHEDRAVFLLYRRFAGARLSPSEILRMLLACPRLTHDARLQLQLSVIRSMRRISSSYFRLFAEPPVRDVVGHMLRADGGEGEFGSGGSSGGAMDGALGPQSGGSMNGSFHPAPVPASFADQNAELAVEIASGTVALQRSTVN